MTPGQYITPNLKLVRKIGEGAMGEVWIAEHMARGSSVAVKLMKAGVVDDEEALLRFREEARAAARIDSLHVTHVYDAGTTENGQPYIVLELLKGETLRERMKRTGAMPMTDVAWIVEQTANGLTAAHKLGIWHRDIKPDNLFVLDHAGKPFIKIMDFGVAKQTDGNPNLSKSGMAMGTPSYMSPQQLTDSKRVDQRADLWSLGVVAYEALTARKPFHGLKIVTLSISVSKGVFKAPSAHRSEIPKSVDEWMLRALATDVDQRFGSAKEMADAFNAAIQKAPLPERKSYAPPSGGNAAPLAPTVAAPASARVLEKPSRAAKDAPRESEPPPKPSAFPPREDPAIVITDHPTRGFVSISGMPAWLRAIGFSQNGDALFASFGGGEVVCLDLGTRRARWWQRLFSRTYALDVGLGIVAVACGDGTVRILDVANGNVTKTLQGHEAAVRCLAQHRGTLVTCGDDKRLTSWNIASGERSFVGVNQGLRIASVAIHPTSGIVVTGAKLGQLRIWDSNLRLEKHEDLRCGTIRQVAFSPDGWSLAGACGDGRVRIWETRGRTLVRTLDDEKKKPVVGLAFDTYGQVLAAGSSDGTLRIWNVTSGQLQRVVPGSGESVEGLVMSPDGRYLAISFADGALQVHKWPLDPRLGEKPREG